MELIVDIGLLIGLTTGMTEAFKRIFKLEGDNARFIPAVSLAFGVLFSLGNFGLHFESGIFGVVVGLSAVGLFSGTRSTIGK